MPIPGAFLVGGDWRTAAVVVPIGNGVTFLIGDLAGVMVDFLIVAAVIFLLARYARRYGIK